MPRPAQDLLRESLEAGEGLTGAIEEHARESVNEIDADQLRRILGEPQHETLGEALAADAVDAAPVLGDLLAVVRKHNAEARGMDYPDRPAFVENALSDLPPPADTVADILVAQNTLNHLRRKRPGR